MRRSRQLALAVGVAAATYVTLVRRWQLEWGTQGDEATGEEPGDALLPDANLISTRAIDIDAAPALVWPWIAQIGQARGGFYSYDFLENLAGCNIHSADRIVDRWQQVDVGGVVKLHPDVEMQIAIAEPGRALVLVADEPADTTPPPFKMSWAFVLGSKPDGTTRLIVRERYQYLTRWAPVIVEPVALVSFVMSRKMMVSIRDRVTRAHGSG